MATGPPQGRSGGFLQVHVKSLPSIPLSGYTIVGPMGRMPKTLGFPVKLLRAQRKTLDSPRSVVDDVAVDGEVCEVSARTSWSYTPGETPEPEIRQQKKLEEGGSLPAEVSGRPAHAHQGRPTRTRHV